MKRIKVVSDGTAPGTKVFFDGSEIPGIQSFRWDNSTRERHGMLKLEISGRFVDVGVERPLDPGEVKKVCLELDDFIDSMGDTST